MPLPREADDQTDETIESTETPPEDSTVVHQDTADLPQRLTSLERETAMLTLLQDPDVRQVVEAKRQGKSFKLVEQSDDTSDEPSIVADLPEDDPMRETLARIEKAIASRIDAKISPLVERLQGVEGLAAEVQKKEVMAQVASAKAKYKDLDKYRMDMVALSKDNPSLGVEDLYILAKHRKGELRQAEQNTHSEKPQSNLRGRSTAKETPTRSSRAERRPFNDILKEALSGLDLDSLS